MSVMKSSKPLPTEYLLSQMEREQSACATLEQINLVAPRWWHVPFSVMLGAGFGLPAYFSGAGSYPSLAYGIAVAALFLAATVSAQARIQHRQLQALISVQRLTLGRSDESEV